MFNLCWVPEAVSNYRGLETNPALLKRLKAVRKTLGLLETHPRHPSLQTHRYRGISGENGEKVFGAYAEQNTPAAYRIFWHYGPGKKDITIIAISPHP